jgi:LacI family transcriptional regulator
MAVTIRQVAARLSLSVTTVSRALMGYSDVAEATRQRVHDVANEMGYVPSQAARQLRRRRADALGLILPSESPRFTDPFFATFIAGVGDEVTRNHHDLLVSLAGPGDAERETYQRIARSRRVDGFVLVRMRASDWRVGYLIQEGIPFAAFGRSATGGDFPYIGVDGATGVETLVRHLVDLGHRRIAFISAPPELTLAQDRLNGYRDGLNRAGIAFEPELVLGETLTLEGGYQAARRLLERHLALSAMIGANDRSALGAMRAVQELGYKVGHDVAIAGFDGTEAGQYAQPPLTTIHQPVYDIGRQITSMLLAKINGDPVDPIQYLLEPELRIRASTTGDDHSPSTSITSIHRILARPKKGGGSIELPGLLRN